MKAIFIFFGAVVILTYSALLTVSWGNRKKHDKYVFSYAEKVNSALPKLLEDRNRLMREPILQSEVKTSDAGHILNSRILFFPANLNQSNQGSLIGNQEVFSHWTDILKAVGADWISDVREKTSSKEFASLDMSWMKELTPSNFWALPPQASAERLIDLRPFRLVVRLRLVEGIAKGEFANAVDEIQVFMKILMTTEHLPLIGIIPKMAADLRAGVLFYRAQIDPGFQTALLISEEAEKIWTRYFFSLPGLFDVRTSIEDISQVISGSPPGICAGFYEAHLNLALELKVLEKSFPEQVAHYDQLVNALPCPAATGRNIDQEVQKKMTHLRGGSSLLGHLSFIPPIRRYIEYELLRTIGFEPVRLYTYMN